MCAGDTTLEWDRGPPFDVEDNLGWGYQHECRDYGAIMRWAEEHRVE